MGKRRYHSRKSSSLIVTAIDAEWWFSALLSAGLFSFASLVLPSIAFQSMLINVVAGAIKSFLWILGGLFALVAFFNFLRRSQLPSNPPVQNLPSNFRSPSQVPVNKASSVTDHQVVQGWSKDNTQWGHLGFQGNSIAAKRPTSWSMELLKKIEWKLFEDLSAAYYQEKGIRAELTKLGADGGIDIKLFQDDSGKPASLVQCKAWNSRQVGIKPIREFLGVMSHEKITKGFFMASGAYTDEATAFANANGITLIDGNMFLRMIQRLPDDAQQRLLDLATYGDYTTPSCPSCGVKMVKRSGKRGEFWGCKNFPRCRQMLHVKSGQ